ncbi:MAG: hypothetical protein ABFC78_07855 [Methanoregula sp.]
MTITTSSAGARKPGTDRIFGQDNPHSEELRTLALANCSCNASLQALVMAEEYHARLLAFIDEIRAGKPE